jgi:Tol biopolymer transport system component/tRNA A-37 threonylcarbamoyl transferase component Bud32
MPLVLGDRLGPYEITSHIGAGGMGEVYRARDPKLNRDVAIKVLPELFARDPERRTRFTREAQTLASLNHPNVAQVYAVQDLPPKGASHAIVGLVMELVEGEDLAARIARGAIPVDEAIPIGLQIACGLEAAHERGIVHRDLKPANVRVTPDGTVKILDFGLAKAADSDGTLQGASYHVDNSPTFTSAPSEVGMILGTAAYMAPEQARGKPVDKRADIWAFGCVIYEMLTAKRPFAGESVTDTLAAIVREDPDWAALPAATPRGLRELLSRCLVKDPKQRVRDIGDARIALERLVAGTADEPVDSRPVAPAGRQFGVRHIAAVSLTAAIAAALAVWAWNRTTPVPPPQFARFVSLLPPEATPLHANGAGVAFAPDGSWMVYAGQPAGQSRSFLFRRRIAGLDVEVIPDTAGAAAPFVSPDGKWIGFFTDIAVMKVSADGGGLSKICDRASFSRADWAANDTIVLGTSQAFGPGPLARVPAAGGRPTPLTTLADNETLHQFPHVLPDGRHVLFTVLGANRVDIAVVSIDGGRHQLLDLEGSGAVFVPPDHLLYARGEAMFTVPFDLAARRVSGSPIQVLDDVAMYAGGSHLRIPTTAVDDAGSVAYVNKRVSASVMAWMEPDGKVKALTAPAGEYRDPRLAGDGQRLAIITAQNGVPDLWVLDLVRGTRLRLTSAYATYPVWSPDGARIAFSDRDTGILSVPADGSSQPALMFTREASKFVFPTSWSPDGGTIVFTSEDRAGARGTRNRDIWMFRTGQKAEAVLASPADEQHGVISPDGKWLAYTSNASGRDEVYVRPLGGSGATIPVSGNGGAAPTWSPKGGSLYFREGDTVMRSTATGSPLQLGTPTLVQSLPPGVTGMSVAPDGRLLLVIRRDDPASREFLHILLNWGPSLR